jgi:HlyD family secretion protein
VNKKKLIPMVAVLVAAAVALGVALARRRGGDGLVRVSGNIEATTYDLSFRLPGVVKARAVTEGDPVRDGQAVAELDDRDLRQELAGRKADLAAARAALAELEAGSRPEEIAGAEADLHSAAADAERTRTEEGRLARLRADGVATAQEYDAARAAAEVAAGRAAAARERLKLLKAGPRKETIDGARARADQAAQALVLAETRLGYAKLASPVGGVVLSKNVEPGEYAAAGTPVVTVGDLTAVYLRAYIDETDLGRVKLGQNAEVTADTWPGKVYPGRVAFIAAQAEFTPKNIQSQKERVKLVYRIKIDIPNPEMELKPGMPADAVILAGAEAR